MTTLLKPKTIKTLMFSAALATTISLGYAAPAHAEITATEISQMPEGTYQLDGNHATVLFKVRHMGFADYIGRFNRLKGEIDFNDDAPEESHASFTIEANSIDTNNEKLEKELKSDKVLFVEKYPNIMFEATDLEMETETSGTMTGDLTMMGETHPVTFDVTFNGGGKHPMSGSDTMGFSAKTTLDRTEWGLDNWAPMVSEDVEVEVHAEFNRVFGNEALAK